jgi:hypothetical protein
MKSTRRSLRNHHGKPSEHGAHDPLRIYMPPLMEWSRSKGGERAWTHPELGWRFVISQRVGWVTMPHGDDWQEKEWFDGKSPVAVHGKMREWYAQQTPTSLRRLSERNPDWSAMRAKASHYGERAVAGARSAYDWTAPRARAAYDWTAPRARAAGHAAWEGTKAAGRAVKRGAKRAAPVIARGAKSAAERMDRWAAEPNGAKYSVYVSGSGWHDSWAVKGGLAAATAEARHAVSGRSEVVSASVYKTADRSARDVVKFTNRDSHGNVGRVRKIGT